MTLRRWQVVKSIVALVVIALTALLLITLFDRLPIEQTGLALDWRGLWQAIQGGQLRYVSDLGFRIPPWDALLVLPFGLISMQAGWGLLNFITLAVLVVSVPRRGNPRLALLATLLLCLSFPSLRHLADGNFEAFVIGGALLIAAGMRERRWLILALGILLASAKPQEVFLLLAALLLYALPEMRKPFWLRVGTALAVVVVPTLLWQGGNWLTAMFGIIQQGSIMDASLHAALNRIGLPAPVLWLFWGALLAVTLGVVWRTRPTFSREKAGMLVAASLLLSPYAAGNSILTVLAVGVVPLFLRKPWLGGLLMVMISLPYLFSRDLLYYGQAYYGTLTLFSCWAVFAWRVWRRADERAPFSVPVRAAEMPLPVESAT